MDQDKKKEMINHIREEQYQEGNYTGWYDHLYKLADDDINQVSWAKQKPNPLLMNWLSHFKQDNLASKAVVVGCGLGDDPVALENAGFDVTAFDISETAIQWCKKRFPQTRVNFVQADLLNIPKQWLGKFDFVLECTTLQSLPEQIRNQAIENIARLSRPGGTILVISMGSNNGQAEWTTPPWPLTKTQLDHFLNFDLSETRFHSEVNNFGNKRSSLRFRIEYQRNE